MIHVYVMDVHINYREYVLSNDGPGYSDRLLVLIGDICETGWAGYTMKLRLMKLRSWGMLRLVGMARSGLSCR